MDRIHWPTLVALDDVKERGEKLAKRLEERAANCCDGIEYGFMEAAEMVRETFVQWKEFSNVVQPVQRPPEAVA